MNSQAAGKIASRILVITLDEENPDARAEKTAPCMAVNMIRIIAAPIIAEMLIRPLLLFSRIYLSPGSKIIAPSIASGNRLSISCSSGPRDGIKVSRSGL